MSYVLVTFLEAIRRCGCDVKNIRESMFYAKGPFTIRVPKRNA
jgi:hypothetical protein